MKKIININFHGRVIPIEESAYEILQQYVESLRKYFAGEEGRDEIINDIENRFAELFSENLKKGAACITDADVNATIASMGRPEDFEQEERTGGAVGGASGAQTGSQANTGAWTSSSGYQGGQGGGGSTSGPFTGRPGSAGGATPHRLYRAENDKILGGVCGGIANYLNIDPAIVRILFVLITFGWGVGFILYIVLWATLPTRSLSFTVRKRLYRNSDDRVIGGVASGLAAYFHIDVWIPRLIFILPLILSMLASIIRHTWFYFGGPIFYTGGFGGSLLIAYIVLWIVLPEASTASEKLEMRGEKVDLESIKNTIKSDMEAFKTRASKMGEEIGSNIASFSAEAGPQVRTATHGIGHAIGVIIKAIFLFIAGLIVFALVLALLGIIFGGANMLVFKDYFIHGLWENTLVWGTFFLFLLVPIIGLLIWLIRRITGARHKGPHLGVLFSILWFLGWVCLITFVATMVKEFRYREHLEQDISLSQPAHGKLWIRTEDQVRDHYYYNNNGIHFDWEKHGPFYTLNDDSVELKTVRVILTRSHDSAFHAHLVKFSRGNDDHYAMELAGQIDFPVHQEDSVLYLPDGFIVHRDQLFRNQQVMVVVAVPVGKKVEIDRDVDRYDWFTINVDRNRWSWDIHGSNRWDINDDEDDAPYFDNSYEWKSGREYLMTGEGLRWTNGDSWNGDSGSEHDGSRGSGRDNKDQQPANPPADNGNEHRYRYHGDTDSQRSHTSAGTILDDPLRAFSLLWGAN